MRCFIVSLCICFQVGGAVAAEPPKPLSEDGRAAIVKEWRAGYDKVLEKAKDDLADATKLKDRQAIARLIASIADMNKNPLKFGGRFGVLEAKPRMNWAGTLRQPSVTVIETRDEAAVVEGFYIENVGRGTGFHVEVTQEKVICRYLVVDPPANTKLKSKVALTGLWCVVGESTLNGVKIPAISKLEVKPEELPPKK